MAFQRVRKILGISAVVIACGTVMFTFTSCGQANTQEPTAVIQEVETEQPEDNNGGNVIEDVDFNQKEAEVTTTKDITVFYDQSATEADNLTITDGNQADVVIKDYVAPEFFPYMTNLGYEYTYNEEEGSLYLGERLISDNVEVTEDGKLNVRDYMLESSIPVVKYVRISENEVEARYITMVPIESHMVSGITFVMEKGESGTYTMTGMLGVFGEDITKLPAWEGTFDGWSMEVGGDVIFSAGDSAKISGSMTLYPHFQDREINILADEDGRVPDGQLEKIGDLVVLRVIHVHKYDNDGNVVSDYALDGLDTEKDNVTGIDKEKVKEQQRDDVKEAEEKKKAEEEQKKKEEETKKKQEESKKKEQQSGGGSGNGSGSSSQKPSGNSGQTASEGGNTAPTGSVEEGADAWGVPAGKEGDGICTGFDGGGLHFN